MSEQTIELSAEERAIILAKREEEKANGLVQQKAYDENVKAYTDSAQNRLDEQVRQNKEQVKAYEDYFTKLLEVSPDYKLVKEDIMFSQKVSVQKLEFIDEDGNRMWKDKDGNRLFNTTEDIDTLTAKGTRCVIKYTGKVPEETSYHINVVEYHPSGYSYNRHAKYKMQWGGTKVWYEDNRRLLTNPKTAHKKITEAIESEILSRKYAIESEEADKRKEVLEVGILAELIERFPNAEIKKSYSSEFGVTLDNGITMKIMYLDQPAVEEEPIKYMVRNITTPQGVDMDSLIEALAGVTVTKED